jgi:AraC-like DNA-binding protein
MSDQGVGVLYTEYSGLKAGTSIASLWSYHTQAREPDRRDITLQPDGRHEYWLDRSDPLLNTILPGTHVSVVFNGGDGWAAGRTLATSALLPRSWVLGPVTRSRILRVGKSVRAVGAVISPTFTSDVLGVPAAELVDRIIPLEDLWSPSEVERLLHCHAQQGTVPAISALRDELTDRIRGPRTGTVGYACPGMVTAQGGRVCVHAMAERYGLGRRRFGREFFEATGLPPKLYARISRFQWLLRALLSNDVSRWASVSSAAGFYDQPHMINEFRTFTGSAPTVFFRPHCTAIESATIRLRGRPSEWPGRREPLSAEATR